MLQLRSLLVFTVFILICGFANAQVTDTIYTQSYLDKSTRFAWTTFGADFLSLSGGKTEFLDGTGNIQTTNWSGSTSPRLTMGGIHFYGHADFYVTFPLNWISVGNEPDVFNQFVHESGIETGMRIYPIALKPQALRPYVGISFRSIAFGFEPQNSGFTKAFPLFERFIYPLQAGLTYATKRYLISFGAHYQTRKNIQYALSETQMGKVSFDPLSFQFGVLKYFDTDAGARSKRGVALLNNQYKVLEKHGGLSGIYLGVGPSTFLQTRTSPLVQNQFPHLSGDNLNAFSIDLAAGYYFHRPDLNIGLSYRGAQASMKSIDDDLAIRRRSVMLEAYKFLFNYRGFVPFLGATGSLEFLRGELNGIETSQTKPALGVIFGWDIRVVNTETWLLRTNLRYIPDLHLDISGDEVALDHLEFNFIQFVYFPGRRSIYKRYRQ